MSTAVSKGCLLVVSALLAMLVAAGCGGGGDTTITTGATHVAAPELPDEVISGQPVDLESLQGHPAIIGFWASWCAPCREQARAMEAISQRGDQVVGIATVDTQAKVQAFTSKEGITYPVLGDSSGDVAKSYGTNGVPETVVLSSHGTIVHRIFGLASESVLANALNSAH